MADDGMLVNFDLGSGPLLVKSTFKGGRWKDRLSAKKAALYNRRKAERPPPNEQPASAASDFDRERFTKRQRLEESIRQSRPQSQTQPPFQPQTRPPAPSTPSKRPGTKRNLPNAKPHQVISSLFTYNPTTTTVENAVVQEAAAAEPSNAPLASELETFTRLGLSTQLADHLLNKLNIKAPTAIQHAAVSQLLSTHADAFLQAETGSGKTLAYLLPIVQKIMALSTSVAASSTETTDHTVHRNSGLFAIILAPTRELSKQISVVLESLLRCAHWIVSGTVIGGEKKKSEKARLRKGLNILIATPGRLADHLDHTEVLDVSNVRWLVLDEGDRLMELGFERDLEKILSKLDFRAKQGAAQALPGLPPHRTTILCSATLSSTVERLGEMSLHDAIRIEATPANAMDGADLTEIQTSAKEQFLAPAQLQQSYAVVPAKQRLVSLIALFKRNFLRRGSVKKAIVFISCADSVDFHFSLLTRSPESDLTSAAPSTSTTTAPAPSIAPDLHLYKLHGSLPQNLRTTTLQSFRTTSTPAILLTTDVAGRGLDLPNIDLVIEYDPPFSAADHLHRIGRTARAGASGRAVIFLQPGSEEGYVAAVLQKCRSPDAPGPVRTDATEILRRGFTPFKPTTTPSSTNDSHEIINPDTTTAKHMTWEDAATAHQLALEQWVLASPAATESARRAFRSHIRAYATHVAAERHIFDLTALHLGHVAKGFALRERPSGLGTLGRGQSGKQKQKQKQQHDVKRKQNDIRDDGKGGDIGAEYDPVAAGRMMRALGQAKAREGASAAEFNY